MGGSLGGLATGIALKALGHDTTILERNTALLHDQGAGIVAGGHALEFLERYNRCQRQAVAVRSERRQYLDRKGNVVHEADAEQNMSSWDLTYYLMRANYDGITSPYCDVPSPDPSHGTAVHLHDRTVTAVQEDGDGVCVSWRSTSDPSRTGTRMSILSCLYPLSAVSELSGAHMLPNHSRHTLIRKSIAEIVG